MTKHNHAAAWFTIPNTNKVKNLNLKHIIKKNVFIWNDFFWIAEIYLKLTQNEKKRMQSQYFALNQNLAVLEKKKKST